MLPNLFVASLLPKNRFPHFGMMDGELAALDAAIEEEIDQGHLGPLRSILNPRNGREGIGD